jgi:hypothetical protein
VLEEEENTVRRKLKSAVNIWRNSPYVKKMIEILNTGEAIIPLRTRLFREGEEYF